MLTINQNIACDLTTVASITHQAAILVSGDKRAEAIRLLRGELEPRLQQIIDTLVRANEGGAA